MKKCILFLTLILLMGSISATLLIQPNPIEIGTKIDKTTSFNFTLENTFDFQIKSFQFSNLDEFTFPDIVLNPNQSKNIEFTVLKHEVTSETIESEISFRYLVEIPEDPQTHHINISLYGFEPNYLQVHQEDTVIWHNFDDISHTVTGGSFDYTLTPNATATHTFNTIGQENYQDLILFWTGTIQVLSRESEQEVNNPNYNKILTVNLDVFSDPTNLSLSVIDTNFTVDATGSTEGLISVENKGGEEAQRVKLTASSDWIKFNEDDFNLGIGEKNFVTFTIQPLVFASNETNKTYNIELRAKALNTEEATGNISVFIPFTDKFEQFDSSEGFLKWFVEVYCVQNPDVFICNTSRNAGDSNVIIRDPEIPINLTASQVYAMLKRIQRIEDSNQRTNNKITLLTGILESEFPEFMFLLNRSVLTSEKTEDERATKEAVFWVIGIITILITGFLVSWKYLEKYQHKKYLMGEIKNK